MGRVATTIDGAENGVTVAQSYQGISNRTFVDPDLIASIDIKKGADSGSRGIAGTVAMRTLSADDVVKPGEKVATDGEVATFLGLASAPPIAEAMAVARDLALAEEAGARIHFRQLSTAPIIMRAAIGQCGIECAISRKNGPPAWRAMKSLARSV